MLKILTWNLSRPNPSTRVRNEIFLDAIKKIDPDIAILTETHECIDPGKTYFKVSSAPYIYVSPPRKILYKYGENAVSIFCKYPLTKKYPASDHFKSVCAETITPLGNLIIYGTIIGLKGGREKSFITDYEAQVKDLESLARHGNVCYGGDLNISFSGYPYPNGTIAENTKKKFDALSLNVVTSGIQDCVIHSVISNNFLKGWEVKAMGCWFEKKVTDHRLVLVTIK